MEKLKSFISKQLTEFYITDEKRELFGIGTEDECKSVIYNFIEGSDAKDDIDLAWQQISDIDVGQDGARKIIHGDVVLDICPTVMAASFATNEDEIFAERFTYNCEDDEFIHSIMKLFKLDDKPFDMKLSKLADNPFNEDLFESIADNDKLIICRFTHSGYEEAFNTIDEAIAKLEDMETNCFDDELAEDIYEVKCDLIEANWNNDCSIIADQDEDGNWVFER